MKTVNLMPTWYFKQQRQKRNLRLHMCMMLALGATMVAGAFVCRQRVSGLNAKLQGANQQLTQMGNPGPDLEAQQAELSRLENLQSAYKELGNTVPMSGVIQQIQNEMTQGMAISHFVITVQHEAVKGSGYVGDAKHPPRYHDVAHLEVVGVAPNDVQIAQLIGKISVNPLFDNVSLNYTKTETLNNYLIRKFEIQMEMDLEPLATEDPDAPKAAAVGEVNHAG